MIFQYRMMPQQPPPAVSSISTQQKPHGVERCQHCLSATPDAANDLNRHEIFHRAAVLLLLVQLGMRNQPEYPYPAVVTSPQTKNARQLTDTPDQSPKTTRAMLKCSSSINSPA